MTNREQSDDEPMIGSPVPEVFPPDDPAARFVVAMPIARSDIDRVFLLACSQHVAGRPGLRLPDPPGDRHLVKAIDSLMRYRATLLEAPATLSFGWALNVHAAYPALEDPARAASRDVTSRVDRELGRGSLKA